MRQTNRYIIWFLLFDQTYQYYALVRSMKINLIYYDVAKSIPLGLRE